MIIVIIAGAFKVDVSNWSPFAPNGYGAVFTGATVVFFAYVGFDAVANSAEESKNPQVSTSLILLALSSKYIYVSLNNLLFCLMLQRDLPLGIIGSLLICVALYIGVCLVITGMVPYNLLGEDAPLATAFTAKGLKFVSVLISVGAVAGLTTTLLVGLYVQVNKMQWWLNALSVPLYIFYFIIFFSNIFCELAVLHEWILLVPTLPPFCLLYWK